MHPSAPAQDATPAPTDPMQALDAHLVDVMAQAEIAANAQRDLDSEAATPPAEAPRQEAPVSETGADDAAEPEESAPAAAAPDDDEDEEADDEEETPAPQPVPAEQPKYSRRDAARFASELEQRTREVAEAKAQLASHQGELAHFRETDQTIKRHLQQQSGYVMEQNGRFKYDNLSEKVLKGTATPEEAEEVTSMTQWHEFAAPIFRAAQDMVLGSFVTDWNTLKDLEGVGDEGMKRLNATSKTTDGARELHALAFAAGQSKAKAESAATIARLKAENKSLKTGVVARAPQPASANGAAVPAQAGFTARAIGPDGLSNPDFDREVAAGKWLDVDLGQQ